MTYAVYQIKTIAATPYRFKSWSRAEKYFDISHYEEKAKGEISSTFDNLSDILSEIWYEYNQNKNLSDGMHRLDASDVVKLGDKYFYYSMSGWLDITEKVKEKNC